MHPAWLLYVRPAKKSCCSSRCRGHARCCAMASPPWRSNRVTDWIWPTRQNVAGARRLGETISVGVRTTYIWPHTCAATRVYRPRGWLYRRGNRVVAATACRRLGGRGGCVLRGHRVFACTNPACIRRSACTGHSGEAARRPAQRSGRSCWWQSSMACPPTISNTPKMNGAGRAWHGCVLLPGVFHVLRETNFPSRNCANTAWRWRWPPTATPAPRPCCRCGRPCELACTHTG